MMDWNCLLSSTRSSENVGKKSERKPTNGDRSEFERDFDRIVYSSAFRRLQDKTQVIPFPETDFVHTRLTHSLEASCLGRSLGKAIGKWVLNNNEALKKRVSDSDFEAIVAAACLAHDIGNPPFGHAGEDAISHFFQEDSREIKTIILADHAQFSENAEAKWQDLTNFEGNANGFRLLLRSGGLDLTYSTLAAYTKYPKGSLPIGDGGNVQEKKYGFFQSEKLEFQSIAETLRLIRTGKEEELKWARHPLAYLVEAADDICYLIMDLEDGVRLNFIPFKKGECLLKQIAGTSFNRMSYAKSDDKREKIGYLRAKAINALVHEAIKAYIQNEDLIMRGIFSKSLISCSANSAVLKAIKDTAGKYIYDHQRVKEIEAAGFEVIPALLDAFVRAVNQKSSSRSVNKKCDAVLELLPRQYLAKNRKPQDNAYDRALSICQFVAGMTDTYATILYRKLKGISLYGRFA